MQPAEWGPPLWRILHTVASRLGRQTIVLLATDEAREFQHLLRVTEAVMPCAMCRAHYRAWRHTHPIEQIGGWATGAEVAQRWLWNLHNGVNRGAGKGELTWEALSDLYGGRVAAEVSADLAELSAVWTRATQQGLLDGARVREWKAVLSLLRRLMGLGS